MRDEYANAGIIYAASPCILIWWNEDLDRVLFYDYRGNGITYIKGDSNIPLSKCDYNLDEEVEYFENLGAPEESIELFKKIWNDDINYPK